MALRYVSAFALLCAVLFEVSMACPRHAYILLDPSVVDMGREGPNLLEDVLGWPGGVTAVESVADMVALLRTSAVREATIIVPEQERGALLFALSTQDVSNFTERVLEGLHLIVACNIRGTNELLINAITPWSMREVGCPDGPVNRTLHGGGFASGPGALYDADAVECADVSSLPEEVDGLYAIANDAYAWTAPLGKGRVTYLGFDWFDFQANAWPALLEASLGWCFGSLQVSPPYDSPFGGALLTLNVTGSSLANANDSLACIFYMTGLQHVVPATVLGDSTAQCVSPPVGHIGRATLGLSRDAGNSSVLNTSFYFVDNLPPEIAVKIGEAELENAPVLLDADIENGEIINVTWTLQASHNSGLDLLAAVYRDGEIESFFVLIEDAPNTGVLAVRSSELIAALDVFENDIAVTFQLVLIPSQNSDERRRLVSLPTTGVQDIVAPAIQMAKQSFFNKVSLVAQSVVDRGIQRITQAARSGLSFIARKGRELSRAAWRSAWSSFLQWDFSNLPSVPCNSLVAGQSPDWEVDPHCPSADKCPYHPGSDICYRQARPGPDGDGHQVCYLGAADNFEINTDPAGAGTADRVSVNQGGWWRGYWASATHVFWDGMPYVILEKTGDLDLYIQHRPNPSKDDCFEELPQPAAAFGDPHLTTFDGFRYTFNGLGEFWFVRTAENVLSVQARMEKVQARDGVDLPATVLTAVVLKTDTSSAVQIGFADASRARLQVLVNGEVEYFDSVLDMKQFDGGVSVLMSPDQTSARLVANALLQMDITAADGALGIVSRANGALANVSTGLLGVFDGEPSNDLQLPNGTVLPVNVTSRQLHYGYGLHWLVDIQDSLFSYSGRDTFATFQNISFKPPFLDELLGSDVNATEVALCGGEAACIFDLRVTGSVSFAAATTALVQEFNEVVEGIEAVRQATTRTSTSTSSTSSSSSVTSTRDRQSDDASATIKQVSMPACSAMLLGLGRLAFLL
mmetsp:Transcript_41367/g.74862  ORF Transcript_41367/g.74862 Transcript_41367/m.74862 type:complete len:975 (-) Transcript_41367:46-2970(-)